MRTLPPGGIRRSGGLVCATDDTPIFLRIPRPEPRGTRGGPPIECHGQGRHRSYPPPRKVDQNSPSRRQRRWRRFPPVLACCAGPRKALGVRKWDRGPFGSNPARRVPRGQWWPSARGPRSQRDGGEIPPSSPARSPRFLVRYRPAGARKGMERGDMLPCAARRPSTRLIRPRPFLFSGRSIGPSGSLGRRSGTVCADDDTFSFPRILGEGARPIRDGRPA